MTAKFRIGLHDGLLTHLRAGADLRRRGCRRHRRARPHRRAALRRRRPLGCHRRAQGAVTSIPVLGNGDIWEAGDAVRMMRHTGCDGVVVGRGCLGRPWLFGDLVAVLSGAAGAAVAPARRRHGRDGRPRLRRSSTTTRRRTASRTVGDANLPQARVVVPHRLPGRQRGPAPLRPGVDARRARRPRRGARPDADGRRPAASASGAATRTARSRSPCPTASSTTSTPSSTTWPCPTTTT